MNAALMLTSVFLVSLSLAGGHEVELDHIAGDYARKFARDCGCDLRWYDLHAKQPHLREQYPDMKIDVRAENIRYGTTTRKIDRPGYVYSQWFHNGGSLPITGLVHKEKSVTSTFTWSVSESLTVGVEVEISAGVPEVINGNIKIETSLNLASTQEKTTTTVDTFRVSHEIVVPPKSKVKAEITITETEVEVPWTATMYVTGHEAIWLEQQCKNHWLWFVGIDQLAPYDQRLIAGKTPFGQGLSFQAKGVFKAVRAMRATVHTKQYPL